MTTAIRDLFRRTPKQTDPASVAETAGPSDSQDTVLMRFRTRGGATIELHPARFTAKFDYRGAPWAVREPYEVKGFNWRCLGCSAYGREDDTFHEDGFRQRREARDDANGHANVCWSMPKPTS